MLITF